MAQAAAGFEALAQLALISVVALLGVKLLDSSIHLSTTEERIAENRDLLQRAGELRREGDQLTERLRTKERERARLATRLRRIPTAHRARRAAVRRELRLLDDDVGRLLERQRALLAEQLILHDIAPP